MSKENIYPFRKEVATEGFHCNGRLASFLVETISVEMLESRPIFVSPLEQVLFVIYTRFHLAAGCLGLCYSISLAL